jgi:uncharacterized membrane protein HdeD (DUF308 family)
MIKNVTIQARVLLVHAVLSLVLGLALFYLRAIMTDLLAEAIAVTIAILISAASLILAAITDWFAALSEGMKHVQRLIFYLLAGLALALAGFTIAYYPEVTMQWLVALAAVHALMFGISGFAFAFRARHHPLERRAMYIFGSLSVAISGLMGALARDIGDRSATDLLGTYLCFLAVKQLFLAWDLQRKVSISKQSWSIISPDAGVLSSSSAKH